MKIVLHSIGEYQLVLFTNKIHPFVVCYTPGESFYKPGDPINSWYWGDYYGDLELALNKLKERAGIRETEVL